MSATNAYAPPISIIIINAQLCTPHALGGCGKNSTVLSLFSSQQPPTTANNFDILCVCAACVQIIKAQAIKKNHLRYDPSPKTAACVMLNNKCTYSIHGVCTPAAGTFFVSPQRHVWGSLRLSVNSTEHHNGATAARLSFADTISVRVCVSVCVNGESLLELDAIRKPVHNISA